MLCVWWVLLEREDDLRRAELLREGDPESSATVFRSKRMRRDDTSFFVEVEAEAHIRQKWRGGEGPVSRGPAGGGGGEKAEKEGGGRQTLPREGHRETSVSDGWTGANQRGSTARVEYRDRFAHANKKERGQKRFMELERLNGTVDQHERRL